jgi:Ser/Thr protein kinase RdoA (MazF antagonist)
MSGPTPAQIEGMSSTPPAEIERFAAIARIALRHYSLVDPVAEFLRFNENLTFRVTAAAGRDRYLLRIHKSATSNFLVQSPATLEGELLWLEALARDTDVAVQKPVRSRRRLPVTTIAPIGEPLPLPCTLLQWIEGETFNQEAANARLLAQRLGELIARLHNHASGWTIPAGFTRVTYGPEFLQRTVSLLKPGVELGLFRAEDLAILSRTTDEILSAISALGRDRQVWGPIHGDLQGHNILVHGEQVRPIDFSLCGFGHYLFDLGVTLSSLRPDLQGSVLDSYRKHRALPADHRRLIEAFALFGMFNAYAFLLPNPAHHDWLRRRVPAVAASECQAFLRGEPYLSIR